MTNQVLGVLQLSSSDQTQSRQLSRFAQPKSVSRMKLYPSRSTSSLAMLLRFKWKQLEIDFSGTSKETLLK